MHMMLIGISKVNINIMSSCLKKYNRSSLVGWRIKQRNESFIMIIIVIIIIIHLQNALLRVKHIQSHIWNIETLFPQTTF